MSEMFCTPEFVLDIPALPGAADIADAVHSLTGGRWIALAPCIGSDTAACKRLIMQWFRLHQIHPMAVVFEVFSLHRSPVASPLPTPAPDNRTWTRSTSTARAWTAPPTSSSTASAPPLPSGDHTPGCASSSTPPSSRRSTSQTSAASCFSARRPRHRPGTSLPVHRRDCSSNRGRGAGVRVRRGKGFYSQQ